MAYVLKINHISKYWQAIALAAADLLLLALFAISFLIELHFQSPNGMYFGWIANGTIAINHIPVQSPDAIISIEVNNTNDMSWWFRWHRLGTIWGLKLPLWPFILASAITTGIYIHRVIRRPRSSECCECGYNLEGIVKTHKCPECGENINAR